MIPDVPRLLRFSRKLQQVKPTRGGSCPIQVCHILEMWHTSRTCNITFNVYYVFSQRT